MFCVWLCAGLVGCGAASAPQPSQAELLHGRSAQASAGIAQVERINDGATPVDGDPWLTDLSAVLGGGAFVVYDLGAPTPIDAIFLVGDNNDRFFVAVSDDGQRYRSLWEAPSVPGAGMRPRHVAGLAARARYVKLTARGGDPSVSVGELMLFAQRPTLWPPKLERRPGRSPTFVAESWVAGCGAALALLCLCALRRVPRALLIVGALLAAAVGVGCAQQLHALWPLPFHLVEWMRGVLAASGAVAVLVWSLPTRMLRPRVPATVLAVLALLGVAAFYNFGRPWFYDQEQRRFTPVHSYDMRVYFPVAKYFHEIDFEGVYLGSVKAYLEGEHLPPSAVAHVELRDLHTNLIVRARDVMPDIDRVKERFSPARWQEFVEDMRYFWRSMGPPDYLGSLRDHGGNATPVWLAIAHMLFAHAPANEHTLTLAALLDPLLLALTFLCIARSFGWRAMLVCLLVFGSTDFPMFGSNWAGATLRFDWMATLGLGACALRTKRPVLAGILLAHAGLARAFPALALLFVPVPVVLYAIERVGRTGLPGLRELRDAHPWLIRTVVGGALAAGLLIGASSALFGFQKAWGGWVGKIALHTEDPNVNHVGVRTVMSFGQSPEDKRAALSGRFSPWQNEQMATYARRTPWAWALRLVFLALCVLACRRARPEQAALLGSMLIPVLFYPANYYCQYLFLLPLLGVDQRMRTRAWIDCVLLLMCTAEYFTVERSGDVRFFWESVILLLGFFMVLVPLSVAALGSARAPAADRS